MAEAEGGAGGGRGARAAELARPARAARRGPSARPSPASKASCRRARPTGRARRDPRSGRGRSWMSSKADFVPPEGPFVLRAAVGEVEDRSRQSALRQPAHVGDVERSLLQACRSPSLEGSAVEAIEVDGGLAEKLSLLRCARAFRHPIDDARPTRDRRWRAPSRASRRHTSSGRTRSTRWRARCRASAARGVQPAWSASLATPEILQKTFSCFASSFMCSRQGSRMPALMPGLPMWSSTKRTSGHFSTILMTFGR